MRVYVAGASREPKRVRRAMDALRERGHQITLDWLAVMESAPGPDAELTRDQLRPYAEADICAIYDADLVWVLAPEASSTGCWVEMGYAMGSGGDVIISGPASGRCIFAALVPVFDSDEDALEVIDELAARRVGR